MKNDTKDESAGRFRKIMDAQPEPESKDRTIATLQAANRLQQALTGVGDQKGDRGINAIEALIQFLKNMKRRK